MTKNKRSKKASFIKELEDHPLVERACRKVGVSRATYYRWRQEDSVFRMDVEIAQERGRDKLTDFAESKLLELMNNSHYPSIVYWLSRNSKRYRPQAIKLYVEENDQQRADLQKLQRLFDELVGLVGVEALMKAAVPDPESFKTRIRKEIKDQRKRSDELY